MLGLAHLGALVALWFHEGVAPASISTERWSWEPGIVIPVALMLVLYVIGAIRRGDGRLLIWRHLSFAGAWTSLFLALASPLHAMGEELFSAHMLQHEILILISAPLFSAAHPGATYLWALAPVNRVSIGGLLHRIEDSHIARTISAPLVAWLAEAVALWAWHVPYLYQATLRSDWVHAAQHMSFFFTAVLFWSALYGVGRSAMSYGAATMYVFGTAVHCSALGALLTVSSVLWYPAYATTTERWGLTPIQDQQLGGVIMWVPSGVVFIVIGLALFAKWLSESDRRLAFGSVQALLREDARE